MSTTMFSNNRPFVLSIAGFDPSGGAGLLGDIKTIESLGCYGLAVNTANTVQSDLQFCACHWTSEDIILHQLKLLLDSFPVEMVKIGIIENRQLLITVIDELLLRNKDTKIIWDPVLKSSSGFPFQQLDAFQADVDFILEKIFLVTPNFDELQWFNPEGTVEESISMLSSKTNLLLKGGHCKEKIGLDELFTTAGKHFTFPPTRTDCSEKHGSGCVLSSAVTAFLALGHPLPEACQKAKNYTEKLLASNKTLLGYHKL
ncbi:hydroxymethylpyrimidine/phosphomethylpyrimidine kinase [uncultured Cyclobacterium sp.]|uniref:hydroxymethylpyrimidine/phosphomethylpyrimidine kinase n=1 Tax=uncultured Cyclobacterium sp. TaxID=453820 RepID=UPI0030EBCBCE